MPTKVNFKAPSILLHFLWNRDFDSLFRGVDAFDLQYFDVLRPDDLNIQVPRASPLIKTDKLCSSKSCILIELTLRSTWISTVSPEQVLIILLLRPGPCDSEKSAEARG